MRKCWAVRNHFNWYISHQLIPDSCFLSHAYLAVFNGSVDAHADIRDKISQFDLVKSVGNPSMTIFNVAVEYDLFRDSCWPVSFESWHHDGVPFIIIDEIQLYSGTDS